MLITDRPFADVDALRNRLYGEVYGPDDAGWDEARRAWNLAIDQRPAAVALPLTDADVVTVVDFAREEGLRVAAQATGHGAGAIASLEGTILISTKHMRGVRIDPGTRRARVRAGAVWADVTGPAAAYGLAPLAGSAPDVGVVGYTLGGGLSWLGRKHGLACNSVVAIELVTADGRHVRVDAAHDPELFWALRGGGGQFGIVTAIEFELYPVEELQGGALMWPVERAEEIFAAWRDWTTTAPDEVTSLCRVLHVPPFADAPEGIRGNSFVVVEAAILGDADVLNPLRALEPEFDLVGPMSPAALIEIHNDPKHPVPGMTGHRLLAGAPDEAIAELVAHASKALVAVELRHLGGALQRSSVCHGALPNLHGEFSLLAVGIVPSAEAAMTVDVALTRLTQAMAPWDSGRAFPNFSERRGRCYDGHAAHRLRALKAQVDGDDLFVAN
jgi:FAD binding domain